MPTGTASSRLSMQSGPERLFCGPNQLLCTASRARSKMAATGPSSLFPGGVSGACGWGCVRGAVLRLLVPGAKLLALVSRGDTFQEGKGCRLLRLGVS